MRSGKAFKAAWLLSLVGTAVIACLFRLPYFEVGEIIKIEFSCDAEALCRGIKDYQSTIYNNLKLDFAFIACYTLLFYTSVKMFAFLLEMKTFNWIWICLLPGFLDVAENMYMLPLTCCGYHTGQFAGFDLFFIAVRAKWLLCIPFAILAFLIMLYQLLEIFDRKAGREN